MDVTKSQNPDSMILASARIELTTDSIKIDKANKTWDFTRLEDLGLARGIKVSFSASKIDVKADNGTVPLKGQTDVKAKVEFSILERHLPLIGKIMHGLVTVKTDPGEKKTVTDENKPNTLEKDTPYEFFAVNFDGSKPSVKSIKQGTKTLAETTDYVIEQKPSGMWCYKFLTAGTFDPAKETLVTYEYTPVKSYTLGKGSGGVVQPIAIRLTNQRKAQDGRMIRRFFEFPYGFYDGDDSITLKSKNDADNLADVPMSFEFSPHPDLVLDDDFEPISLYRERQEV